MGSNMAKKEDPPEYTENASDNKQELELTKLLNEQHAKLFEEQRMKRKNESIENAKKAVEYILETIKKGNVNELTAEKTNDGTNYYEMRANFIYLAVDEIEEVRSILKGLNDRYKFTYGNGDKYRLFI